MSEFQQLLEKYLRDELDPVELQQFLTSVKRPQHLDELHQVLSERLGQKTYSGLSDKRQIDVMFRQMLSKASDEDKADIQDSSMLPADRKTTFIAPSSRRLFFLRSIAALFIFLAVGTYLWNRNSHPTQVAVSTPKPAVRHDVAPGGNKAILTLADGSTISLSDAGNGKVAQQGGTQLVKLANGQLVYRSAGKTTGEVLYNTMSTPRGGQFKLSLPDGTQVWLNASSSITYPTAFTGTERKVSMRGEAYFEVASRASMPFKVLASGMEVAVTGTHFNVNAYADESAVTATLLEGGVKITKGSSSTVLRPGQQAVCGSDGGVDLTDDVDLDESIAWKNGLFSFNGADIPLIMRQLARWYDLDVQYEGTIPKRRFTGKMFRNLNLSESLKVLELSHVHFRVEGKMLTVLP